MKSIVSFLASTGIALALSACAPDLSLALEGGDMEDFSSEYGENLSHEDLPDGATKTVVDATDADAWIYLDLESRMQVTPATPEDSRDWDIAFRRFEIKTNGGVNGQGGVEAVGIEGMAFEAVAVAPIEGYRVDAVDGPEEDNLLMDYVLNDWFNYSPMSHILTPRPVVFIVRSVESTYFKFAIDGYYSEAGTAGIMQFHWAEIDPPV